MKSIKLFLIPVLTVLFVACEKPNHPFYNDETDPNPTGRPAAVIESLEPSMGFLGEEITINGSGFDLTPVNNLVVFRNKPAQIVSTAENQLVVIAPDIIDDTVKVKVAVKGSEYWSNEVEFIFLDVVTVISDQIPNPTGAEMDADFNTYIGSRTDQRIYKVTSDGTHSVLVDAIPVNGAVKFGPDNFLYVATTAGVSRVSADGNTVESVVELANVLEFDWDQSGRLYLLLANGVYRFDGSGAPVRLTTNNGASGLRVYNDHVYVAEQWFSRVQRYAISDAGLTFVDTPFRYTSAIAGLEIDKNGKMYLGAWFRTYLLAATSTEVFEHLFDGAIPTNIYRLNYFGKTILAVQSGAQGKVLRLYVAIDGAPQYGKQ